MSARSIMICLIVAIVTAACAAPAASARTHASAPNDVAYAAIGASETYGAGADDRAHQAWPQLFFNDSMPATAVLYNFGIPGATTAQALKDEVPPALAVHPNVVTVWLNVNDLVHGVSAADYAGQLRQVVHALRQGGKAQVLVANVPDLRQLPAFKACLPNPPGSGAACALPTGLLPSTGQVTDLINGYNMAIAQVAKQEGATLVDLYTADARIAQHPEWVSSDGYHPSAQGYVAIAHAFEAAYRPIG